MIFFMLKVIGLAAIIRYLRVFDLQSILMFIGSCFFFYIVFEAENIPELIVFNTMALFFAWIIISAVIKNPLKSKNFKFGVKTIGKYADFFYAMVTILFFMLVLFEYISYDNKVILYFGSVAVYLVMVVLRDYAGPYVSKYRLFDYRNTFFLVVLYCIAFLKYELLLQLFGLGFVYVVIFIVYEMLYDSFTDALKPDDLVPGMILAEHIVKKDKIYVKKGVFFFTPVSVLRDRLSNKVRGDKIVFGSFQPLSVGDIRIIGKIMGTYGIADIRVQRTVDIRPFLLAGIVVLMIRLGFV